ncbi:MAG: beta-ketoacyl-ACP reductase [Halobacteriales archaeon]|nr:beta-ketoacyl-ACP reductase [Halobacteriales archaeon]
MAESATEFTRTCVITGASRGIGRGIAEQLGSEGANVAVNYHWSEEAAQEVAERIEEYGGNAIPVQADVTSEEDVLAMRDQVHEAFGAVDVVVNNAGLTEDQKFENMTRDEWRRVIEVTLDGAFNVSQAFFQDLKDSQQGRLVNISSVVGKQGNYGQANYAAAKSGLFGFTRSLALELAPHDATANCVAPGYTKTDMIEGVPEKILDSIREDIPLKRFAEVEEIADVVCFLVSERASYITGEVIDVNGAMDL